MVREPCGGLGVPAREKQAGRARAASASRRRREARAAAGGVRGGCEARRTPRAGLRTRGVPQRCQQAVVRRRVAQEGLQLTQPGDAALPVLGVACGAAGRLSVSLLLALAKRRPAACRNAAAAPDAMRSAWQRLPQARGEALRRAHPGARQETAKHRCRSAPARRASDASCACAPAPPWGRHRPRSGSGRFFSGDSRSGCLRVAVGRRTDAKSKRLFSLPALLRRACKAWRTHARASLPSASRRRCLPAASRL